MIMNIKAYFSEWFACHISTKNNLEASDIHCEYIFIANNKNRHSLCRKSKKSRKDLSVY